MPETAEALARTMISAHGDRAIAMAAKAAESVQSRGKQDRADLWLEVIAIIKAKLARE